MMSKQTVLAPSLKLVTTSSAADAPLSSHPNLVGLNLKPPCPSSNGSADAVNTAALEAGCIQQETIISNKKHGNLKRPASKISLNDYEASLTRSSSGDLVRLEAAAESASGVSLPPLRREGQGLTEKKLRRLEKNRISARECRRKKREAAQNMEREINILESENLRLRLQLQIGDEAEESIQHEQERVTEQLDILLKSGASESEIYEQIEFFKEKFADYGRDRRSAIEFHLKNVKRLLMPTSTTSVAIRALSGGMYNAGDLATQSQLSSTDASTAANPMNTYASSDIASPQSLTAQTIVSNKPPPLEPKALFHYLVQYLEVTPEQAVELKDSRQVAKELDSVLAEVLNVLQQLRLLLNQCNEDLEHEFSNVRSILTPTQAAKFLVWVANNSACMHMLNELWSKVYYEPAIDDREGTASSVQPME